MVFTIMPQMMCN